MVVVERTPKPPKSERDVAIDGLLAAEKKIAEIDGKMKRLAKTRARWARKAARYAKIGRSATTVRRAINLGGSKL